MNHRLFALAAVLSAGAVLLSASSVAAAAPGPGWTITSVSYPTNFTPGDSSGDEKYEVIATNVGGAPTDGSPVTVADTLPAGLTLAASGASATDTSPFPSNTITCSASGQAVTCSDPDTEPIASGGMITMTVPVEVSASAPASVINQVSVSGGGAEAPAATGEPTTVSATPASFGVHSFGVSVSNADGSTDTQAGSHPYAITTSFALSSELGPVQSEGQRNPIPNGNVRDINVELPPGLIGNPLATPRCTNAELNEGGECPASTQVGTILLVFGEQGFLDTNGPVQVYNMVPPPGVPAEFEFKAEFTTPVYLDASVRSGSDYGITIHVSEINEGLPLVFQSLTFWGVPAEVNGGGAVPAPFLTLPTSCSGQAQAMTARADSWQVAGAFQGASASLPVNAGCDRLDFTPSVSVQPTTTVADSPSGVVADLKVPQNQNQTGLREADLRDARVALPAGVSLSPGAADGLVGCTAAQIALSSEAPASCPPASQVGTVTIISPLLPDALTGQVFLGAPDCSPCTNADAADGKIVHGYIQAQGDGVLIKLPGSFTLDPATGQVTAHFLDNPQLPLSDLKLDFKGGPRGLIATPDSCGTFTSQSDLSPWSSPFTPDARTSDSFSIGAGCVSRFSPTFTAGVTNPQAAAHSPFVLSFSRSDTDQELSGLSVELPPGLLAKLAGVPLCSDADANAGTCPADSQVGTVETGAGPGSNPFFLPGKAYLTGPYKGGPYGLDVVVPVQAGPFDLGVVVVRQALHVDPQSAQVTAVSDPFPAILDGIPLRLRRVDVDLNRPEFIVNPTSCDPMAITGTLTSTGGMSAAVNSRFQVAGCQGLAFKPRLTLRVFGKTNRNAKPRFRAVLRTEPGEANIGRAQVNLPHSEFLEQSHIKTICTRVQFAAGDGHGSACPPGSIYGHAKAWTPLLDQPLEGPVYLRSSSHKLPDLVAALSGQIDIDLDGKIDSGKNHGLRTTFEAVPDAPVSKFVLTMRGGNKGLLVNSENLCSKQAKTSAMVRFEGHNGKVDQFKPQVANQCQRHGGAKEKRRAKPTSMGEREKG